MFSSTFNKHSHFINETPQVFVYSPLPSVRPCVRASGICLSFSLNEQVFKMETLETVYCREKNYKHIVNEGSLKDKDFGDVFLFKTTNSHPPPYKEKESVQSCTCM